MRLDVGVVGGQRLDAVGRHALFTFSITPAKIAIFSQTCSCLQPLVNTLMNRENSDDSFLMTFSGVFREVFWSFLSCSIVSWQISSIFVPTLEVWWA